MKNVLEFLENSASQFPNKTISADLSSSLTYQEFVERAKAMGSFLATTNIRRQPVAVFLDKSADSLAAYMSVVYSGNFYVVLDTQMPLERIRIILDTLHPAIILTCRSYQEKANEFGTDAQLFFVEDAKACPIDIELLQNIRRSMIDTDPLYVLFTSGSTGVPKGAVIGHRSVIAYANWVCETFDIDENTIMGNQTPFYFSMSVLDIFSIFKAGGTLHIIPKEYFSFPIKLFEFLQERNVNTIYWVPSALCLIANWKALDYWQLPLLKKVLFAGEVMPTKQLNYWIAHMPDIFFANLYGPTEVTDICTYYAVDRTLQDDEPLPIGKACNNCDVIILTEDNKAAKAGEEGELCVRGSFLAYGYYNNPQVTEKSFQQNPLNPNYPEMIYRTGDLVKQNENDEILYITRKDFQIKRMGYRIELGEIETAAGALKNVEACCCIYDAEKDKIVLIVSGGKGIDTSEIWSGIRERVPAYMHPNQLIHTRQMPYNSNGKIDRNWLKKNYATLVK